MVYQIRGKIRGHKRTLKARQKRLLYVRKKTKMIKEILVEHSYFSLKEKTAPLKEDSDGPETFCSSIRNNFLSIISLRESTAVEVKEESPPQDERSSIPEVCCDTGTDNTIQSFHGADLTVGNEVEVYVGWIVEDEVQEPENMCVDVVDDPISSCNERQVEITKSDLELDTELGSWSPPAENSEDFCLLCAAKNSSREYNTLTACHAKMITDFSGVDILKYNSLPTACASCYKVVLELWEFKKQIIDAEKHIKEGPMQEPETGNELDSQFEFIDCNKQELSESSDTSDEDEFIRSNYVRATGNSEPEPNKCEYTIKLIPIDKLQKESEKSSKKNAKDEVLFKCLKCRHCLPRKYLYSHWCEKARHLLHLESKKEAESYVCEVCGKQYNRLRSIKRHEISHGVKKHICHVCDEPFHYVSNLQRHMRTHTGAKPFACPFCDKRFTVQWNLNQHKRMHTNITPYKCKLCSAAFRHNVTLKKHIGMKHTADEFARQNPDEQNSPTDSMTLSENNKQTMENGMTAVNDSPITNDKNNIETDEANRIASPTIGIKAVKNTQISDFE